MPEAMEATMRGTVRGTPTSAPAPASHRGCYRRHVDLLRVVSAACPA